MNHSNILILSVIIIIIASTGQPEPLLGLSDVHFGCLRHLDTKHIAFMRAWEIACTSD